MREKRGYKSGSRLLGKSWGNNWGVKKGGQKLQVKFGAKVRGVNGGKLGVKTFGDNNSGEKLGAKRGGNHKLL